MTLDGLQLVAILTEGSLESGPVSGVSEAHAHSLQLRNFGHLDGQLSLHCLGTIEVQVALLPSPSSSTSLPRWQSWHPPLPDGPERL